MNKQQRKLGVTIIALVCLFWIHPTFAADATTTTPETPWLTELLNALLKFLSWGWMLLAFLAGKLMSNDFIYGTFINLDSALFTLWNYMKNIANFLLGFLFLAGILKAFFTKDAFELKKVLPRYLLAGVIIQMSWFIMGAFIDLANIATAAVGAFPQQFIQGSTDQLSKNKMMQLAVSVPKKVDVSLKPNDPLFTTYTGTQTIEDMFGKFNDLSGPLMFMGASIFRFQDYNITNESISDRKNFSIGLFIKLFLLIAFCVPMLALIVINLIRIFRLWMWISFSPLAAIAWSFGDKATPGVIKTTGDKLGFGKLSDVLSLIFQPVVMIGSLSLVMILSIGMYYVLGGDPGNQQSGSNFSKTIEDVRVEAQGEVSTLKELTTGTEITVDGDLFANVGNFVGGMVGYLIITGFTVVLLWSLLKIGASFSKFTKDAANNVFKWSEKLVSNANIIPVGGNLASFASMKETGGQVKKYFTSGAYANKQVDDQTDRLTSSFFKSDFGKATQKTFGIPSQDIKNYDIQATEKSTLLQTAGSSVETVLKAFRDAASKKRITSQSSNFRSAFNTLMSSNFEFQKFMLEGAQITPEEYNANKSNLLGENAVGAKMRKFLAYALNNPSVKPGGGPINPSKVDEEILKNFKSSVILPSTPLIPEKAAEKE